MCLRSRLAIWWIMCRSNCFEFGGFPKLFYISSGYIMFCLIILDIWRFDTNEP